ncbi:MAG: glycosyltransferase family 4 protein [Chloroflexi bacterium]|nr:glycosyltransferase family 4 protein [Chloroflexota bacterium]
MERLKVLVSAFACEPGKGSEPGIGWNWVRQIARFHDVWVITRANNREVIEHAVAEEPMPNIQWVYFDLPRWARFWKKGQRGIHLYYYLWQIGIYWVAKRLQGEVGFDLVHHVTLGIYWMPSFLSLLPAPFVWGPVGGGESAPWDFYSSFSLRGKVYEYARSIARWFGEHDPFVRMMARRARVSLAKAPETASRLRDLSSSRVLVLSDAALPEEEIGGLASTPLRRGSAIRLLSLGNLLHWKGFHLGLEAFARFQREFVASEYWIIGDGPERGNLERLAKRLGMADRVTFCGALARDHVFEKLVDCDVLVHPTLHDSAGWVCIEAMATGLPVICLDLGGPAMQVTEETGFKIRAESPEQAVEDMAQAMLRLAEDPELRRIMGEAARERAQEHFSWGKKGKTIAELYEKVLTPCR